MLKEQEGTDLLSNEMIDPMTGKTIGQKELAKQLLAQAKEQGASLVWLGGPRCGLTKHDLRIALGTEMTEPLKIRQ